MLAFRMRSSRALALIVGTLTLVAIAHAQDGAFALPADAGAVPRFRDRVLDCAAHGAWIAPESWSVGQTPNGDVIAVEPHGRAILIRAQTRTHTTHIRRTADFERVAGDVARRWAPGASFDPVVEHPRSRWHVDRRIEGTATVGGVAMRVIAESRGERQLWVAIHPAAVLTLGADIDATMTSFLMLTDHACECGYDCDRRPAQ